MTDHAGDGYGRTSLYLKGYVLFMHDRFLMPSIYKALPLVLVFISPLSVPFAPRFPQYVIVVGSCVMTMEKTRVYW